MIKLPPGCTVCYNIVIDIEELTPSMIDWYNTIEGRIKYDTYHNYKGQEVKQPYVAYGKSKWCHYHHNAPGHSVRLHFQGEDASVASMFLLKYMDLVMHHNLKELGELHG
jgi:hypothetical protein